MLQHFKYPQLQYSECNYLFVGCGVNARCNSPHYEPNKESESYSGWTVAGRCADFRRWIRYHYILNQYSTSVPVCTEVGLLIAVRCTVGKRKLLPTEFMLEIAKNDVRDGKEEK